MRINEPATSKIYMEGIRIGKSLNIMPTDISEKHIHFIRAFNPIKNRIVV